MAKPAIATPSPAKRRGRTPVPANETVEGKLIRLAQARIPNAVRCIRLVGNLAGYKPTEAQVEKIMNTLDVAVTNCENQLKGSKNTVAGFSLS